MAKGKVVKTPKRLIRAPIPAINLVDEIKVSAELLKKQRIKDNAEFEYALIATTDDRELDDINDEFQREVIFEEQAKQAASQVIARLKQLSIPTEVPKTYKGEMVKDERQMARIREDLKDRKGAVEKSEKMKKLRELKKMGKKIQEEVLRKRQKEKKEFLDKVKKKPVSELFDD